MAIRREVDSRVKYDLRFYRYPANWGGYGRDKSLYFSSYGFELGFGFVENRRVKFEPFTAAVSGDRWGREIN